MSGPSLIGVSAEPSGYGAYRATTEAIDMSYRPEIEVPGVMDLGDRPPSNMECVAQGIRDSAETIFRCRIL